MDHAQTAAPPRQKHIVSFLEARMRLFANCAVILVLAVAPSRASAGEKPKPAAQPERDAAFAKLSQFVGGTWTNDNPKFVIETRYEWILNKTAMRALGTIDKGGKNESHFESTLGWDPVKKTVYYLDFHGGEQVFFGTVTFKGDEFQFDFDTIVGTPAKWRSVGRLSDDNNSYQFTIYGQKDGKWEPNHKIALKRKKS
jgi:hypothetical protein